MGMVDIVKFNMYNKFKQLLWNKRKEMQENGIDVNDASKLIEGFADALIENINLDYLKE